MKKFLVVMLALMSFMVKPAHALEKVEAETSTISIERESKGDNFSSESDMIIKRMESAIKSLPSSNNIDYNFLSEMILLHSEGIQLSIVIQGYTDNPEIIDYASDLVDYENGELTEMRIARKDLLDKKDTATKGNDAYLKEFNNLVKDRFNKLYGYTKVNDPAKDYVNIMNLWNQADVDLAATYLKYSDNDVVRKIAENIINVKTGQIAKGEELLRTLK